MGMGYGNPGDGYLNSMTNSVFQFQSLVFTVGQAVQIVGMNTQALSQMYQSMKGLIYECRDQMTIAVKVIQQEQSRAFALSTINENEASEEDIRRARIVKRRIQVLRWSMAIMVSIGGYKLVKYLLGIIFGARRRKSMVTAAASAAVPLLSSNVNNATRRHGNGITNGDYYGNYGGTQTPPPPVNDHLSPHNAVYSPYNTSSNGGGPSTLPAGQLSYNPRHIDNEYGRRLDSHYNGGHNGMYHPTSYR
mmetsp:Transcript_60948/g.71300  ORF Transcript_60948/g.71300 Transcript_60948/m.71300 type:complete len:248 (-) Transcript_60948:55-798(-)